MPTYQNINNLVTKLRFSDQYTQNVLIKKISDDFSRANRLDMEELMETVVNVTDFELQVKLFSLLSAYLVSKGEYYDVILTCTRLYDIIYTAINNGVSQKTTTTLNFISSLLYIDDDFDSSRRKNLILYAQNMLRVSGCLTTISVLFCNTMMYKDTWISLCRALSECCKGCEQNQSHCSYLIPMCIQKLRQKQADVFFVLLSLIQNNIRNINIFLQANGVSIFTREYLQLDFCLQVLNSLVEQSSDAVHQIQDSGVLKLLRDLLKAYGPTSQIGLWATVIMYHADTQLKKNTEKKSDPEKIIECSNNTQLQSDEIFTKTTKQVPNPDDTAVLLTNIVKELHTWQSQSQMNNLRLNSFQNVFTHNMNIPLKKQMQIKTLIPDAPANHNFDRGNEHDNQEMSFSFVDKQIKQFSNIRLKSESNASMKSIISHINNKTTMRKHANNFKNNHHNNMSISNYQPTTCARDISFVCDDHRELTYTSGFKPNYMSTPTHKQINRYHDTILKQKTNRDYDPQKIMRIEMKKHKNKQNLSVKQVKNRSMSARLFDVINESCTTVMKTFKSMFKSKQGTKDSLRGESVSNSASSTPKISCSYSFTNYMRKRDALLSDGKTIKYSDKDSSRSVNGCNTCNDTLLLKHKLHNDKQLKITLKKLKLGINLYGCDFKKISKHLWPREKYMTPNVLYQLYRKLIVKH